MSNDQTIAVRDNPAESRYEAIVDGRVAMAQYRLAGDHITFIHTEVPVELEGRGIASQLARYALDDARRRGLRVIPICPFISAYIRRHPEYDDIVDWPRRQ